MLDQHHADMYALLQMQQRLIGLLREALLYAPSDAWLERAVQMITDTPAQLFGLRQRGRIAPGYHADLVVFDPATVGSEPATLVNDLPGGTPRLTADAIGVVRVLVNGVETVADNRPTGAVPGQVLRSGRDTYTVPTST